jgi:hypothetical protein
MEWLLLHLRGVRGSRLVGRERGIALQFLVFDRHASSIMVCCFSLF